MKIKKEIEFGYPTIRIDMEWIHQEFRDRIYPEGGIDFEMVTSKKIYPLYYSGLSYYMPADVMRMYHYLSFLKYTANKIDQILSNLKSKETKKLKDSIFVGSSDIPENEIHNLSHYFVHSYMRGKISVLSKGLYWQCPYKEDNKHFLKYSKDERLFNGSYNIPNLYIYETLRNKKIQKVFELGNLSLITMVTEYVVSSNTVSIYFLFKNDKKNIKQLHEKNEFISCFSDILTQRFISNAKIYWNMYHKRLSVADYNKEKYNLSVHNGKIILEIDKKLYEEKEKELNTLINHFKNMLQENPSKIKRGVFY